jgi:hypothetical protein
MDQITSLTFFRYGSLGSKIWAFGMMQFAHGALAKTKGLSFYKLMGSGRERFNPFPDWSVYALLMVWEKEADADRFFKSSALMQRYRNRCSEHWTLYLRSIQSKGAWAGSNPFQKSLSIGDDIPFIAVITRASIRPKLLWKFWRSVPASQQPLHNNPGLVITMGIGELPILQMATFSLWKDEQSLMAFAYQSAAHKRAILQTRKLDWYSEELFSRFQPYRSYGTWNSADPLPGLS